MKALSSWPLAVWRFLRGSLTSPARTSYGSSTSSATSGSLAPFQQHALHSISSDSKGSPQAIPKPAVSSKVWTRSVDNELGGHIAHDLDLEQNPVHTEDGIRVQQIISQRTQMSFADAV